MNKNKNRFNLKNLKTKAKKNNLVNKNGITLNGLVNFKENIIHERINKEKNRFLGDIKKW